MKKHISELTDRELEYLIAKQVGALPPTLDEFNKTHNWEPLSNLVQSMPIIERLGCQFTQRKGEWTARVVIKAADFPERFKNWPFNQSAISATGPTMQHAGLRLALAAAVGTTFDVPEGIGRR